MPVKLRVSKMRGQKITPEAVELFRRGLELQALGADEIDYDADEKTADQLEYSDVEHKLHWSIFHLVGEAGPLDVFPGMERNPYPVLYDESVDHALDLRAHLLKAINRNDR
jgi:hypothetical protein